jgi:tetratricopeptide (TPR) repeat protein
MQACFVWATYLWKTWWPFDLTPMYPDLIKFDPLSWPFLLSALLVVGLSVGLFVQRRRWSGLATAWVAYLILLVPMLGLSEHPHHANDRYSYIPAVLWSLALGALLVRVWPRRERAVSFVLFGAVLITAGVLSFQQASHWRDRHTLLTHITSTLKTHPLRAPQDVLLGFSYYQKGSNEQAIVCYQAALQADPESSDAHAGLGDVLSEQWKFKDAIPHYREAMRINPKQAGMRENYAIALAGLGQFENAAEQLRAAIKLNGTNAAVHHNLGLTLAKLGQQDEAKAAFAEAQRLRGK